MELWIAGGAMALGFAALALDGWSTRRVTLAAARLEVMVVPPGCVVVLRLPLTELSSVEQRWLGKAMRLALPQGARALVLLRGQYLSVLPENAVEQELRGRTEYGSESQGSKRTPGAVNNPVGCA